MVVMKQDLNGTLIKLRQALAYDYRVVPLVVPDTPVFQAVALPLGPEVTGLKPRLPSGRGLSLPQAMVSAGAEALELRASLAWCNMARMAKLPLQDGRRMVETQDLRSGTSVLLPAQMVFLDLAAALREPLETEARSTGCATAPNRQDATARALLECIERDAIVYWWHGGVAAFDLPLDKIDALAPRLLWWLQTRARKTRLLGLVSETGVPVVVAVSSDADGAGVAYGAAARFNAAAACLAAVTEMVQTETAFFAARNVVANDGPPSDATAWQNYASTLIQPQFNPTKLGPPTSWKTYTFANLLDTLAALRLQALSVDLTLPDDPFPTIRVLVPGLCDMGGRIDTPRFRRHSGVTDPSHPLPYHQPEPF